jgi:glycosyltransferase involved in cell wall biosynthesis
VYVILLNLLPIYSAKIRRKYRLLGRMHALHRAFNQLDVDVAIVFGADLWAQIALWPFRRKTPAILSIRVDPRTSSDAQSWEGMSRLAEPSADTIVTLTEDTRQFYEARSHTPVRVIPNFVLPNPHAPASLENCRLIVSHGRLNKVKGLDILMRAFACVHQVLPDSRLLLIGDGNERANLEILRDTLGTQHAITFSGSMNEVEAVLASSGLYVLSSRSEAFGNALLEAMAAGLPVIATDCAGPLSMIQNGDNGLIVPREDVPALASAMEKVLTDCTLRERLALRAFETASQYYPAQVLPQWDAAIQFAIAHHHSRAQKS